MNAGIRLNNLCIFLRVFNNDKVVCRHDIYHKSSLAVSTINRCLDVCITGQLIRGAGSNGDLRRQNFRLTENGGTLLRILQGALKYEV